MDNSERQSVDERSEEIILPRAGNEVGRRGRVVLPARTTQVGFTADGGHSLHVESEMVQAVGLIDWRDMQKDCRCASKVQARIVAGRQWER